MRLIFFALICFIWGATWIALKFGLASVPPLIFAGTRFVAAGAGLLIYLRLSGVRLLVERTDIPRFTVVTASMTVASYALLFWGSTKVSSGLSAILNLATVPIALLSIGVAFGEEWFGRRRLAAILCGTAGLIFLFAERVTDFSSGSFGEFAGALACVGSAVTYALGSVLARPLLRRYSTTLVSGLTIFYGGVVLSLTAGALEPGALAALSGDWGVMAWLGWLFLVIFGSLCAYTMYMRLVRDWGPSRAGTYAFISPLIAVLLGGAVFGERLSALECLGMVLMLIGAALSLPASARKGMRAALQKS